MDIQLAVFDMAGTTVSDNNNVANAFQKAFARQGITINAESVRPLMGYHKPFAIQLVLERLREVFNAEMVDQIHEDFENEMLEFYEFDPEVKPLAGAAEVFESLKERGVRIALNTGFSRKVADSIINRFQWKDKGLVDDVIGSDEVEMGRPYPFMIKELMLRAGIEDPLFVAKIGDTSVDIEEGQNAGCRYVIAVTSGAFAEDELQKMNPTHIIHHLSELPAILK